MTIESQVRFVVMLQYVETCIYIHAAFVNVDSICQGWIRFTVIMLVMDCLCVCDGLLVCVQCASVWFHVISMNPVAKERCGISCRHASVRVTNLFPLSQLTYCNKEHFLSA